MNKVSIVFELTTSTENRWDDDGDWDLRDQYAGLRGGSLMAHRLKLVELGVLHPKVPGIRGIH